MSDTDIDERNDTVSALNIAGVSNLGSLLRRLPLGEQARGLAQRIGTWDTRAHDRAESKPKPFPSNVADMNEQQLSEVYAYWSGELIRLHQLTGLLNGQRKFLDLEVKKAQARARSAIRKEYEDKVAAEPTVKVPKPTASEINDRASENDAVLQAESSRVLLDVVLASVDGYREGCLAATTSLSREISFRQAQYTARLR